MIAGSALFHRITSAPLGERHGGSFVNAALAVPRRAQASTIDQGPPTWPTL